MNADVLPRPPPDEQLAGEAIRVLESGHPGSVWAVSGPPIQCRKSRVIPLAERGGIRQAGLKIYHQAHAANRQAAGLIHGAAMGGGGHAVPALYHHDTSANALLIEWIPAPHLEQALVRAALRPECHWRTLSRVGAWLRDFHAIGGINAGPFDAARYGELLSTRMAASRSGVRDLSRDPLWQRSLGWLQRRLATLDGTEVPIALTHGDFTFTNVLVEPHRITGIDVWADLRLPLVEDLARMFVYLSMGDPLPLRARFGPMPLGARRSQQALLEGYGGLDEASMTVWETVVCFEALARWLALSDRLARRPKLTEYWKRAGVRGVLTSIVGRG